MKLSVIMPSRNQGRFIGDALSSVACQQHEDNLEIIVQDCVSDDETPRVLAQYADLPFVRVIRERDRGQSDALRNGFDQAHGDILCWLNSDDVMCASTVERVIDAFETHPEADVVYGEAVFINEGGALVGRFPTAVPSLQNLRHRCVLSQPSVFFRRQAYADVGGINQGLHYCMDYELWTRLVMHGYRFKQIDFVLSATRLHSNTKTFSGGLAFIEEICRMQDAVFGIASPTWRIYERSRSPRLQRYRSKLLRFLVAGAQQVAYQPSCVPSILRASVERLSAEIGARARLLHSDPG